MYSLIIVEYSIDRALSQLLKAKLNIKWKKMGCFVPFFCKFLCFFSFHIFKLLALGFKEKNQIFSWAFLKKSCSLVDPLSYNESFGKTIYMKISRQESAVR